MVRVESRGYRVSVGKPEEKRLCGRPVHEWRVILKWIVRNYDLRMYVLRTYVSTCLCVYYVFMYVCVCMYVLCMFLCMYVFTYVRVYV